MFLSGTKSPEENELGSNCFVVHWTVFPIYLLSDNRCVGCCVFLLLLLLLLFFSFVAMKTLFLTYLHKLVKLSNNLVDEWDTDFFSVFLETLKCSF